MKASKLTHAALGALLALALAAGPATAAPVARSAATCADYDNQADAQRNADTRDADGDGIYCETLPCPCSRGGSGGSDDDEAAERRRAAERRAAARRKAAARRRAARRRAAVRHRREERRRRAIETRSWTVYDVVDGDTLKVQSGSRRETVRLIGIDTPETRKPNSPVECGGLEATSHMLSLTFPAPTDSDDNGLLDTENATAGIKAKLTTDRTQAFRDNYGRLLAYVDATGDLPATQTRAYDVAVKMLRAGWAGIYVFDRDFRRLDRYEAAAFDAVDANAGVWGMCDADFHKPVE